jgi:acetate kinase
MKSSEERVLAGELEGIGLDKGRFRIRDMANQSLFDQLEYLPDHNKSLTILFEWLKNQSIGQYLDAIGHRVVHGGPKLREHQLATPQLMDELRRLSPFIPNHLPHEIHGIEAALRFYPDTKQMICFDTAFHRDMPKVAKMYALPRQFWEQGIMRYGFHGLSYEYIIEELKKEAGGEVAQGRLIIAHLGHGASMVAVNQGRAQDTTMGFTPTEGLVMGTRSGDLDPGVILYLLKAKDFTSNDINQLINHQSGLLGISEISSDMKTLLAREKEDPRAADAIALFCYRAKKYLGALSATLGSLDTIIFTGGIGENSSAIRWRICQDLKFLGISLDHQRNEQNAPIISTNESQVTVRVLPTNEELMIARHTYQLIRKEKINHEN